MSAREIGKIDGEGSKRRKIEDQDVNCRLRHGLNVHCLAHIFQYLDSSDLYTVGGMNEFYKQIINDLVIPGHEVNLQQLVGRGIMIPEVFERYGTKIRKISFINNSDCEIFTFSQLLQSITQHCAIDQLKSVTICFERKDNFHLPIQFKNVEKLSIQGPFTALCVQQGELESLRYLDLYGIKLDSNFDWTKLTNLTELKLRTTKTNNQNFIEFLRRRPNIRTFHHDRYTFGDSVQDICEAVAKYCGNRIREYSGPNALYERMKYNFISGFKNVKKMCLETDEICGSDLIEAMKRLAENNTIEEFCWTYTFVDRNCGRHKCNFQENQNYNGSDMMHFSHLRTVQIRCGHFGEWDEDFAHGTVYDPLKLFKVYRSQILSNVENLIFELENGSTKIMMAGLLDVIGFASKLRTLNLKVGDLSFDFAAMILTVLGKILQERNNNNGQFNGDFIEIQLRNHVNFEKFAMLNDNNESIKLIELKY